MQSDADRLRELAEAIAADLFVNGFGAEAERLVLTSDSTGRTHGGWCRGAVVDRIAARLSATPPSAVEVPREVREAAIRECIEALYGRVEREEYGHAKAAVALDIEALRALLPTPPEEPRLREAALEERGEAGA